MGMTIDLALDIFKHPTDYFPSEREDADKFAIDTMRKYQKIVEIVNSKTTRLSYEEGFRQIKKVVEDGKDT